MKNFNISTNVYFGENSLGILDTIQDKHVLIVCDRLDIGIASVGWAVLENDIPCHKSGAHYDLKMKYPPTGQSLFFAPVPYETL